MSNPSYTAAFVRSLHPLHPRDPPGSSMTHALRSDRCSFQQILEWHSWQRAGRMILILEARRTLDDTDDTAVSSGHALACVERYTPGDWLRFSSSKTAA
eukprot:2276521-Rhodomonas_salina.2